ncbi:hypothetical protein QBC45DRAFT_463667 [Copromyces sp. CBS 386.78]|nr:hypothetical protein QBC45DRAFT_463667 [Copromyces sp. CBS 386.78]
MEPDPPTTPRTPLKRKSPSSDATGLSQPRNHKRQRTVEREDPAFKPSHLSLNQQATSPEKIVESQYQDEESEGEATMSEPMDIESQDTAGNHVQVAHNLQHALNGNPRRPIFASSLEPELPTSGIDDLRSDPEFKLDSDDEEFNSVTKGSSRSNRIVSRYKEDYYYAMCYMDYYNSLPEPELRHQAIRWIEEDSKDDPNGTVVYPPAWYIGTRFDPPRPKIWIKDFFSGIVRPRKLINDRLAVMTVAQREKWAREHGIGGSNDEDTDMDTE